MKQRIIKRVICKLLGGCIFNEMPLGYVENEIYKVNCKCSRCGKEFTYEVPYKNLAHDVDVMERMLNPIVAERTTYETE